MLEGLLHHKKEEKNYLCALVVTEDRMDAALWETTKDGRVTVLKTATEKYAGEWETAIDAADKAVTSIEDGLPDGVDLTKVVFGLFPEWLTEDHIKEIYLKKLKQLTTSLSLTPLGFVELPIAVVHLLQKDEGIQPTVILMGLESKHVTVSLFKIGKLTGSVTHERTKDISFDLEKALSTFTDVEVLPSRILLYGTDDIGKIKAELFNYPWQKKANFLHFPKIETLPDEFPVKAVAVASNTEITPHREEPVMPAVPSPSPTGETAMQTEASTSEEVTEIAEDLGFVKDQDIAEAPVREEAIPDTEEVANVTAAGVSPVPRPKFKLPALPRIVFPAFDRKNIIIVLLFIITFFGGSGFLLYWVWPHATVRLLISPQIFDTTEEIKLDLEASQPDPVEKILPVKEMKVEVTGSKTVPATQPKIVGNKANGEVAIYNKTLNTKALKKGTVVVSNKLKFTLDEDVSVASASEGVGSLTYGNGKAKITAVSIGTSSNLPAGTDFEFVDFPASSYSARNEKSLDGGTSRDIMSIGRDDQKKARTEGIAELEEKAKSELNKQLLTGEKILDKSLISKITSETFSKEVGEEADNVSVDLAVSIIALVYNENDLFTLLKDVISGNIPKNYEYKKEDVKVSVESVKNNDKDKPIFTTRIILNLLPILETADLSKRLAGQSVVVATDYLKSQSAIAGVEFKIDTPFGLFKDKFPANSNNIKISVVSL